MNVAMVRIAMRTFLSQKIGDWRKFNMGVIRRQMYNRRARIGRGTNYRRVQLRPNKSRESRQCGPCRL
jgi:hypothetical protein